MKENEYVTGVVLSDIKCHTMILKQVMAFQLLLKAF